VDRSSAEGALVEVPKAMRRARCGTVTPRHRMRGLGGG